MAILSTRVAILVLSISSLAIGMVWLNTSAAADEPAAGAVPGPAIASNAFYVSNRQPLAPSPLVKLPIGSIAPRGWLRHNLELEAKGLTGRLAEVSPWCKFDGNSWTDPKGEGHSGWEELPYWLKGYGDLGYVLKDEAIVKEARKWIEAILASQDDDGWFGPRGLRTSLDGKPDLWPHMLALNVLQSHYEVTADPRVFSFMAKYFRWEQSCPDADFLTGYWPKLRAGDNLESIYWLYNRTGESWLLDVAKKVHEHTSDWTSGVPNWHGVNLSQGFRQPAVYFMQAKESKFLDAAERNYQTVMGLYGQVPGGGFGADENCRPGFGDPRQGFETCSMVEFMHSFEMLTKISSNPIWADRCEEVAFNSLPAAQTPDLKALHYLTGANMVRLDKENKSPGIENGGTMLSFSPFEVYRCCQHNVSHGWPYYAEELWLATADNGLCASLYAASEVTAKVGDGSTVKIVEETDYPFGEQVKLTVAAAKRVAFPLQLRIPRWCDNPLVKVNGQAVEILRSPVGYRVIRRTWADGDVVSLELPMRLAVRTWEKNQNSVSIDYGPLTFSLAIGEKWVRYGGTDDWPEQEVLAATPWNYALAIDAKSPANSLEIVRRPGPIAPQPFTREAAPIELRAKGRKVPAWRLDERGLVGKLQASPVRTDEPVETLTLIPMGCARLRVSAFPTVAAAGQGHEWQLPAEASHCFANDSVDALNDGLEPKNSIDHSIPRFTWWDHKGTTEWVQYNFAAPRKLSAAQVYWFDDSGIGGCRVPESWRLLVKDGDAWKPVSGASGYGVEIDKYNRVTFEAVTAEAIRLEVKLHADFSGGILEWKVE